MFLLNEMLVFAPGRHREALDRLAWIHGLMASKSGFRQAIVARYLGDPARHTVLRVWQDEQSFQRFREGPDGDYGKGRPRGLYTNDAVVPRWNGFLEGSEESSESKHGNYLVKIQQEMPEEAWEGFHEHAERLWHTMRSVGDLTNLWMLRAKGGNESLAIAQYEDGAGFQRLLDSADYAKVIETLPAGDRPLVTQCFEVVGETPAV